MNRIGFLIPAYRPDEALPGLAAELAGWDEGPVLVVDDGSGPEFEAVFAEVEALPGVELLRHPENLGKGAALKSGFTELDRDGLIGIVTLDADGQHLPGDVRRLAQALRERPDTLVLGRRTFEDQSIPWRSRFGNECTRWAFRLVMGKWVRDTQTGLRALPIAFAREMRPAPADRYEFEVDMLAAACVRGVPIHEIPIETVYVDDNASSHFRPLVDSFRIYRVLFRFVVVAMGSAVLDFTLFAILHRLTGHIFLSQVGARAVSLVVNYALVRNKVFAAGEASHRRAFPRYLALAAASALLGYGLIRAFHALGLAVLLAKLIAETIVFVVNYIVQRSWVFRRKG